MKTMHLCWPTPSFLTTFMLCCDASLPFFRYIDVHCYSLVYKSSPIPLQFNIKHAYPGECPCSLFYQIDEQEYLRNRGTQIYTHESSINDTELKKQLIWSSTPLHCNTFFCYHLWGLFDSSWRCVLSKIHALRNSPMVRALVSNYKSLDSNPKWD